MATPRPKTTRIADDTSQDVPQSTSAGDAPADTFDPKERASSASPNKAAAAADGHGTVNAIEPVASVPDSTPTGNRTELMTAYDGTNSAVTLVHNLDTGVTKAPIEHEISTAVALGAYIVEGDHVYQVTTAGTTASTKPTFSAAAVGGTVTDGGATWTRRV